MKEDSVKIIKLYGGLMVFAMCVLYANVLVNRFLYQKYGINLFEIGAVISIVLVFGITIIVLIRASQPYERKKEQEILQKLEGASDVKRIQLYNSVQVYCGTFLFGPFIGFYLIAYNYKELGNEESYHKYIKIALGVTVVLGIIVGLTPEETINQIPRYVLPLLEVILVVMPFRKQYGIYKSEFEVCLKPSIKRAFLAGLLGAFILLVATVSATFIGISF